MNVVSTFSGIGGFDRGLELAGHTVVAQVERDEFRQAVLAKHWPKVPLHDDITTFAGGHYASIGLLAGGFPCQDLSVAGKRAGLAGARSGLFFEFARVADEGKAEWILLENVPGLLSSHDGADFRVVLGTLAELGFHDLAWRVLDSRFFGVAQRRRRVYVLASRGGGEVSAREVLLDPEGVRWDPAARGEAGTEVASTLGGGSGRRGWCDDFERSGAFLPATARTLTAHHGRSDGDTETFIATEVNALTGSWGHAGVDDNDAQAGKIVSMHITQDPITAEDETPALSRGGKDGSSTIAVALPWVENQRSEVRIMGDGTYTGALPAQPGQKQAPMLLDERLVVRRLTPTECERLQGFPDGWTCLCGTTCSSMNPTCKALGKRYAALGDAVTVNVAQWIGSRLPGRGIPF